MLSGPNNQKNEDSLLSLVSNQPTQLNESSKEIEVDINDIFQNLNQPSLKESLVDPKRVTIVKTDNLNTTPIPLTAGSIAVASPRDIFKTNIGKQLLSKTEGKEIISFNNMKNNILNAKPEDYKNYFAHTLDAQFGNKTNICRLVDYDRIFNQLDKDPISLDNIIAITDKVSKKTVLNPKFYDLLKANPELEIEYNLHPENHIENADYEFDPSDPEHEVNVASAESWETGMNEISEFREAILSQYNDSHPKEKVNHESNEQSREKNKIPLQKRVSAELKNDNNDFINSKVQGVDSKNYKKTANEFADRASEEKKDSIDHQSKERSDEAKIKSKKLKSKEDAYFSKLNDDKKAK